LRTPLAADLALEMAAGVLSKALLDPMIALWVTPLSVASAQFGTFDAVE
jgi:hypothetical protein